MNSEDVKSAIHTADSPPRPVDYYFVETMRALRCSDHHSDDSDTECACRKYSKYTGSNERCDVDSGNTTFSSIDDDCGNGRERSWSHSAIEQYDKAGKLPELEDKNGTRRLNTRRHSDGMLLKGHIKMNDSDSHVHWADDDHKELTRCRPRKRYSRHPAGRHTPVKSILKPSSTTTSTDSLHLLHPTWPSDHEDDIKS